MSPIDKMHALAEHMGVLAAFNILIEALVAAKTIEGASLAALLQTKIDEWRATDDPTVREAANVLIHVRRPLVSEERAMQRALLNDEAKGQA